METSVTPPSALPPDGSDVISGGGCLLCQHHRGVWEDASHLNQGNWLLPPAVLPSDAWPGEHLCLLLVPRSLCVRAAQVFHARPAGPILGFLGLVQCVGSALLSFCVGRS